MVAKTGVDRTDSQPVAGFSAQQARVPVQSEGADHGSEQRPAARKGPNGSRRPVRNRFAGDPRPTTPD